MNINESLFLTNLLVLHFSIVQFSSKYCEILITCFRTCVQKPTFISSELFRILSVIDYEILLNRFNKKILPLC